MNAPKALDWVRLAFLVGLWGSAFAITTVALRSAPPELIVAGRAWTAVALMWGWAFVERARLPKVLPRPDRLWGWFAALGFFGVTAPFLLVAYAQTQISSAMTGVLMAMMPLFTAFLAHLFVPAERLTRQGLAGFVVGFAGVVYLIGPEALTGWGSAHLLAQFAALSAACCYATSSVVTRLAPANSAVLTGAGMMTMAAIMVTPLAIIGVMRLEAPITALSYAAIVTLGVGATGLGSIVWVQLVRSAGPSFMSLVNYLIPIVAVLIGWVIGETLPTRIFLALPIILLGILLVGIQRR